ncbi:hypothetical protein EVAR_48181_1 [Eumeta japonica]|uniref:Uncharacterized protein n=1 Tax=Eumeta variegata TaxID=151549 RepID=A0A4C1XVX7_EUMVA|nr:hypothetical protein EVAR_48181_1 [Eumeta japonica]
MYNNRSRFDFDKKHWVFARPPRALRMAKYSRRMCEEPRRKRDGTLITSGGARRRRRRRSPTASRLKGPRKQKSFAYKLLKRGLAKSFAYKLLKRGLANLMSPTSTSGVAPPLLITDTFETHFKIIFNWLAPSVPARCGRVRCAHADDVIMHILSTSIRTSLSVPPQLGGEHAELAEGERQGLPARTLSRAHQHLENCGKQHDTHTSFPFPGAAGRPEVAARAAAAADVSAVRAFVTN